MTCDLYCCRFVYEGPLLNTIYKAVPHAQFSNLSRKSLRELVIDGRLNQDPVRTNAGLSGIAELREHGACNCQTEISILNYDEWRVSSKFERDTFDGAHAARRKLLAHCCGAGEAEFRNTSVFDEHS